MQAGTEDWRGRATRLSLAVVVHLVAVFLAYFLSPPIAFKKPSNDLQVVMLPAPAERPAFPKHAARARRQQKQATPPAPKPPTTELDTTSLPLNMIYVSSDVYRAGDISKIHPSRDASAPAAGASQEGMADADGAVGKGPDGAPLYDAEVLHAPTFAEVFFYMPNGTPHRSMSGTMMCKMMVDERLDDCRAIEESPRGTGMARAMRQAAWIFRVRPYRIGKKPIPGVWVRVQYDLVVTNVQK